MKYLIVMLLLHNLFSQPLRDTPPFLKIVIPEHGFKNFNSKAACVVPEADNWQYANFGDVNIALCTQGPEGSGHYWQIFIGLTNRPGAIPNRGICLETSTIGWRYRQLPGQKALFWLKDLDDDEKPELIIWDSKPLHSDSVQVAFTLVARVFKFDGRSTFIFQNHLSQTLNKQLVPAKQNFRIKIRNLSGRKKHENILKKGMLKQLDSLIKK